jgi:predicted naringenin-chalcone synthase
VNAIAVATPPHDVHHAFRTFIGQQLNGRREAAVFNRMADRAGIEHRFSYLEPVVRDGQVVGDTEGFYAPGAFPSTAERMRRFETWAPQLAVTALQQMREHVDFSRVTHLVVASCTGFVAPGVDQLIVETLGLDPGVERTSVGFMGCYAAVSGLRLAHHFVRSEPDARVLVVNLELCTLHFQEAAGLEQILAMLLFGDGCSAALVTAEESGIALVDFRAATIAQSADAITWKIGDFGFDMHLSGEVPRRIAEALGAEQRRNDPDGLLRGRRAQDFDVFAVHAGGRTILDAVETGLGLTPAALAWSREVLRDVGNVSSATLMFILKRILDGFRPSGDGGGDGFAVAFGPGLAAESFRFQVLA